MKLPWIAKLDRFVQCEDVQFAVFDCGVKRSTVSVSGKWIRRRRPDIVLRAVELARQLAGEVMGEPELVISGNKGSDPILRVDLGGLKND